MDKTIFIEDIEEGSEFTGFYALRQCEVRESGNSVRLELELVDRTGKMPAVVWENAREIAAGLGVGSVAKVMGRLGTYRDRPQVTVQKIRSAEESEYDVTWLLPTAPKDMDSLWEKAERFRESITDPFLRTLIDMIFDNEQFIREYRRTPGGTRWHHVYLGGLLDHSLGVTEICDFVAGNHPELNRDLLIVAALLHDVGKIKEFTVDTVIEYSDAGRLEGHIVMGDRFVRNYCERIEGFPQRYKMLLTHLMLAHQGYKEFSSPVEPSIPEAFVLYFADEIDSKLNALNRVRAKTADDGGGWSDYVRILGRSVFFDTGREVD